MKTVFDIAVSAETVDPDILEKINSAGQAILKLAHSEGVEIHFHGFTDETIGGFPKLMIECNDDFVEEMEELDEVIGVSANTGLFSTDRDADIQAFYERQISL